MRCDAMGTYSAVSPPDRPSFLQERLPSSVLPDCESNEARQSARERGLKRDEEGNGEEEGRYAPGIEISPITLIWFTVGKRASLSASRATGLHAIGEEEMTAPTRDLSSALREGKRGKDERKRRRGMRDAPSNRDAPIARYVSILSRLSVNSFCDLFQA